MKATRIVLVLATAAAAFLAWWLIGRDVNVPGVAAKAPPVKHGFRAKSGNTAPSVREDDDDVPAATYKAPADVRSRFNESNDYLAFAASVFDAAKQGDGAAQYYLHRALLYCESLYGAYFTVHLPGGEVRYRTLEEANQLTANHPLFTPDDVRDMQSRCGHLMDMTPPPYGTSREWLEAAVAAGYPLAQVTAAANAALSTRQVPATPDGQTAAEDVRHLLIDALRTKDPEVMARVGDVASNLAGGDGHSMIEKQWIWAMAACGGDEKCPALTDSLRYLCRLDPQCQPFESPVDVIRRRSGNDFQEIERRAHELRDKIDAGTLEESDI